MEDLMKDAIKNFNERSKTDEDLRKALDGKTRSVEIEITNGKTYHFNLQDNQMTELEEGAVDNPDVKITTDLATMEGILKKEINPLKAYASGNLKFKASLMDLLTLKKFF